MMTYKKKYLTMGLLLCFLIPQFYISSINAVDSATTIIISRNIGSSSIYNRVAISGNGDYLLTSVYNVTTGCNSTLYRVPDSFTGDMETIYSTDRSGYSFLGIDDTGSRMVVGDAGSDKIICFSNTSETPNWEITSSGEIMNVRISPNGEYVVYVEDQGTYQYTYLISGSDKSIKYKYNMSTQFSRDIEVSNNGVAAISLSNSTLVVFDQNGVKFQSKNSGALADITLSIDGTQVLGTWYYVLTCLYDINGTVLFNTSRTIDVNGAHLSRQSKDLIISSYNDADPTQTNISYYKNGNYTSPAWTIVTGNNHRIARLSDDGNIAVTSDLQGYVRIIDTRTETVLMKHQTKGYVVSIDTDITGENIVLLFNDGLIIGYKTTLGDIDTDGNILDQIKNTFTMENLYGLLIVGVAGLLLGLLLRGGKKK